MRMETLPWVDDVLGTREKLVFDLYFGYNGRPQTKVSEIAKRFCVTPQRISQIKKGAVDKLIEHWDMTPPAVAG